MSVTAQDSEQSCGVSIYDTAAMAALRRELKTDPEAIRRLRSDFFKRQLAPDQCLERAPKVIAKALAERVRFQSLSLEHRFDSRVDGASKLIFRTSAGFNIESVILRATTGRVALCVSSQVGCAAACDFCATGRMGIARNLTFSEIADQITQANLILREEGRRVRNLVFMGMGEPLHNTHHVFTAIDLLIAPDGFHHPPSRILLSTVGLPEELVACATRFPKVNHAISLHSASPTIRESIIPLAKRHPLPQIRQAIESLNRIQPDKNAVMIEYLMLDGVNDTEDEAASLVAWLQGLRVHVNLIPFNPVDEATHLRCSPKQRIEAFGALLKSHGIPTTIRYSMGSDIDAACGQLVKRENRAIAARQSIEQAR